MSYVSQQSKLFGFSVPLYPTDSYTGVITNVPEDATEILSLKGEMIDFTNITQYSDIVLHSGGDYVLRIRREDTYIHLEILEVSTNQTAVLWWTGFGSNYKWWICASINDSDGNIYLFAVSDTNHAWVNRGTSDHTPISGVSSSGLLIKRFFKNTQISGGGAGSGYIGNSLVSNKKMVGYNVPTSSAESTKTESVEDASASPVSGKPKIGNGHAKIRFIRDLIETNLSSLAKNTDFVNHRKVSQTSTDNISFQYTFADLTSYYLSDWILSGSPNTNTYQNGEFNIPIAGVYGSGFLSNGVAIPINGDTKIYGVKFDCKVVYTIDGSLPRQGFLELIKIGSGNTVTRIDLLRICRDPSTSYDPNNPSHRLAEDDLYHTYEFIFDSPVTFDYVHVNGSDVDVYIKNIKLLT